MHHLIPTTIDFDTIANDTQVDRDRVVADLARSGGHVRDLQTRGYTRAEAKVALRRARWRNRLSALRRGPRPPVVVRYPDPHPVPTGNVDVIVDSDNSFLRVGDWWVHVRWGIDDAVRFDSTWVAIAVRGRIEQVAPVRARLFFDDVRDASCFDFSTLPDDVSSSLSFEDVSAVIMHARRRTPLPSRISKAKGAHVLILGTPLTVQAPAPEAEPGSVVSVPADTRPVSLPHLELPGVADHAFTAVVGAAGTGKTTMAADAVLRAAAAGETTVYVAEHAGEATRVASALRETGVEVDEIDLTGSMQRGLFDPILVDPDGDTGFSPRRATKMIMGLGLFDRPHETEIAHALHVALGRGGKRSIGSALEWAIESGEVAEEDCPPQFLRKVLDAADQSPLVGAMIGFDNSEPLRLVKGCATVVLLGQRQTESAFESLATLVERIDVTFCTEVHSALAFALADTGGGFLAIEDENAVTMRSKFALSAWLDVRVMATMRLSAEAVYDLHWLTLPRVLFGPLYSDSSHTSSVDWDLVLHPSPEQTETAMWIQTQIEITSRVVDRVSDRAMFRAGGDGWTSWWVDSGVADRTYVEYQPDESLLSALAGSGVSVGLVHHVVHDHQRQ